MKTKRKKQSNKDLNLKTTTKTKITITSVLRFKKKIEELEENIYTSKRKRVSD